MNHELWQILAALPIGAGLGLVFFGGLWLTVRRVPASNRPYLLLAASFLLRLAVVLAGFYLLIPLGWQGMASAMAGLLIVRQVLLKRNGRPQCNPAG